MPLVGPTTSLNGLRFDNRFTRELPADPETRNFTRQVNQACYSRVMPTTVVRPQLIAHSREVAEILDLGDEVIQSDEFAQIFAGNRVIDGMDPFAMCYGGHQFGNWAGQLGDGRAINLGEVVNSKNQHWTLQLKGAGQTPYSRHADGLAVLRSSVREFLCSEAMHHLGVPTTRALSLALTGEKVIRDMFYDGNPERELGAVVCRVAPSFTRFGNFEIFASRGDQPTLQRLVDHTLLNDFPHLGPPSKSAYVTMFDEVCRRTASMIVHWMRVGFVHGVMNTDNMSILGLTIDYGPYGWLENFDNDWTPNTTDASGRRYCFGNQPQIAAWNLVQLANAWMPIVGEVEGLQAGINRYSTEFRSGWETMIASKLGLRDFQPDTDESLVADLFEILNLVETDMTIFFRNLAKIDCEPNGNSDMVHDESLIAPLREAYYNLDELTSDMMQRTGGWIRRYQTRVQSDGMLNQARAAQMNRVNPKYVLRNYLAQVAIDHATTGDYSEIIELLELLRNPYHEQPGKENYAKKRPEWARNRAGCSMLSCSS